MSSKTRSLSLVAFLTAVCLTPGWLNAQRQPNGGQGRRFQPSRQSGGKTGRQVRNNQRGARTRNSGVARATNLAPVRRRQLARPFPPLTARHQKFRARLLNYWERESSKIKRYRCTFKSWEYNPSFAPRSQPFKYSEGKIQYEAPDKGLFHETKVMQFTVVKGKASYKPIGPKQQREHWLCNGQSVFKYNYPQQILEESILPKQMRGQAIADGPIPFLFGAKANKLLNRYWIRVITPEGKHDQYWLEAWPKWTQDQANYQKVHIIIDYQKWLPKGLVIFPPNFHPQRNPARRSFTFIKREQNYGKKNLIRSLFSQEFYEPKIYQGWRKVTQRPPANMGRK